MCSSRQLVVLSKCTSSSGEILKVEPVLSESASVSRGDLDHDEPAGLPAGLLLTATRWDADAVQFCAHDVNETVTAPESQSSRVERLVWGRQQTVRCYDH